MKFVVGLSGTHGTGKSTILKGAKAADYCVSEAQLSRSAQKALGWDNLSRAQESVENMWALQNAVLTAMDARDAEIEASHQVTLVERSPADMWAYTKMWCGRLGIDSDNDPLAREYKKQCIELTKRYAAIIVVPMVDAIPFVEEPNRADLASRIPVAENISEFLTSNFVRSTDIVGISPEARIDETLSVVDTCLLVNLSFMQVIS